MLPWERTLHQTCKSLLLFLIFVSDLNLCSHYLSVQECAAGFYRLRSGFLASAPASRVPTATGMGSCVQCQCSGHSSSCDPETSICQVCVCVCVGILPLETILEPYAEQFLEERGG